MNTLQLQHTLTTNTMTRTQLGRVCALDQLPTVIRHKPKLYIVNSQPRHRPGRHWLALYFPKVGYAEFFDSLGHEPSYYHWRLERYLKRQGDTYKRNESRYQQVGTNTCGQFCLYYAYQRCSGRSMTDIELDFKKEDLDYNEELVREFSANWTLERDLESLTLH